MLQMYNFPRLQERFRRIGKEFGESEHSGIQQFYEPDVRQEFPERDKKT